MAERILYLVRHGHYHLTDGIKGSLTDIGIEQARATGEALRQLPITSITCSTWPRAEETAHLIAESFPDLDVTRARALIELPPLYAVTHNNGDQAAPEDMATAERPNIQMATGNGHAALVTNGAWLEYLKEKKPKMAPADLIQRELARADRAYERFFKATRGEDKHEVIVAHGTLIRYFITKVLGAPPQTWARMACANCGITRVAIVPRHMAGVTQVYLESFMDVGHLPVYLRT